MEYHKYPVKLLEDIQGLFRNFRKLVDDTDDLTFKQSEPFIFYIEGAKPGWFFEISKPRLDSNNKFNISYSCRPASAIDPNNFTSSGVIEYCYNAFNNWRDLTQRYQKIAITREEDFINQYEKEFYEDLKILDEDADTAPFKLPQQLLLYSYYEYAEKMLEQEIQKGEPVQELKAEATFLKNNIQNCTKNKALKGFSRFLAKAQQAGIKYLNPLWLDGKKEAVKRGINYVFDHVPDALTYIHTHITAFIT
ncbi:hypothetical protein [Segetibacter aerophilus]|uniref:Uncharacterized protein n=1 Tax=Segetibacter aerophilus TaxID=670293 RepID=A0A512B9W4_9BACT|nr:hypothetical protein [Segetibacter aerophilus]GEO08745.1 hypothetical protein SAE01_12410 [Segetibacter aerophilus]